jgi:LAO/AO transport system kinase
VPSEKQLIAAAAGGDLFALARLISSIERGESSPELVSLVLEASAPPRATSYTVGVTGAPGAGKSTLTDRLVAEIRRSGQRVAVLAVDPSSPFSGGALLGDRVRMREHFLDPNVFIRSMASRGHLGGLAVAAPEAIRLLGAVGWPWVVVETVGVGQVEVSVAAEADTTIVVVNPGWGDAIQANKAGLLEIADIFVINKADLDGTAGTRADLEAMLDMNPVPAMEPGMERWRPAIVGTVASAGSGVDELWQTVLAHRGWLEGSGGLISTRKRRARAQFDQVLAARLNRILRDLDHGQAYRQVQEALDRGELDPAAAADQLLVRLRVGPPE